MGRAASSWKTLTTPWRRWRRRHAWIGGAFAASSSDASPPTGARVQHALPRELEESALVDGASMWRIYWHIWMPLSRATIAAVGIFTFVHAWNNFLWPLIITNSVESRPVTVGLQVFSATDQGIDWSIINAATLLSAGPLLIAFLLFQRQFVQSFMRAGIK